MTDFIIDHYHPLSAYHVDGKGNKSVMNSVFKKMLFQPKVLDSIFEPYELKKTFEIWFELELMSILTKIVKNICDTNHISLCEENVICKEVSGPFSTILGVDQYNYGWNLYGLVLMKEKEEASLTKDQYLYSIRFLLQFFKTFHHFRPFYHCSDEEVYKMIKDDMKRDVDKKRFHVERFEFKEFEVMEIYKWSKLYKNSVLYIIQKIYAGRIPTWENESILKEIKRFVHKLLHLPDANDLRCNNNLLYLYFNDKIKLPITYRRKIEVIENKRLTTSELETMKRYSPSFLMDNVFIVDKKSQYHLEYRREIKMDNFVFPTILEAVYYKLLCIYSPKNVAYQKSSNLTLETWDKTLKEYFKKHFHRIAFEKMKSIQYRLSLLQTGDKNIVNHDKIDPISGIGDNFLGKMLMDIRSEIKDYMSDERNLTEKESVIYFLNRWLTLWKKCDILEDEKIHFYFEFYFSDIVPKKCNSDIIFPIDLENVDNHDVIQGYFQMFKYPSILLDEKKLMNVFSKRTNDIMLQYMQKNWNSFFLFQKEIWKHFKFVKKSEITPFNEQTELSLKKYIVFKHFLMYD